MLLFCRFGGQGQKEISDHTADDKRQITIGFAISVFGTLTPPQVIFEGTMEQSHPPNADVRICIYPWVRESPSLTTTWVQDTIHNGMTCPFVCFSFAELAL